MKTEILYSRADWKYHKDRLGYDDVIDSRGRLVATISVMDLAKEEMLREWYVSASRPREIFVLEGDGFWSVYISARWLTPKKVQGALGKLGKLLDRTFLFDPYHLPEPLSARYRREFRAMEKRERRSKWVSFREFAKSLGIELPSKRPRRKSRRGAKLQSHKLKD